ncbi:MAG: hypothetical protein COB37_06410 [Kordiimonadales bacterium]|nr:MAG: hypothetical protein COB37_06410 [Kordiimonadales bacterium]
MARIAKLTKPELAEKLMAVFENSGFEGASLKTLAEAAGQSKASLYHHFPGGKAEMAETVLARAGMRLQKHILSPLAERGAGQDRLLNSLEGVAVYYGGTVPVCLMNSLLLGEGRALFGRGIGQAVAIWKKGLEVALVSAGESHREATAWAAYAVERIQGALVMCRVQQSRDPLEACLSELASDIAALGV